MEQLRQCLFKMFSMEAVGALPSQKVHYGGSWGSIFSKVRYRGSRGSVFSKGSAWWQLGQCRLKGSVRRQLRRCLLKRFSMEAVEAVSSQKVQYGGS